MDHSQNTADVTLILDDVKALLMHTAGKHTTEGEDLPLVVTGNRANGVGFNGHRNQVWAELRKQYPEKMDLSKLEGEKLKDNECPAKFLRSFQTRWRKGTGSAWKSNNTTQSLLKVMVKKAMPQEVQKRLDNVVRLIRCSGHCLLNIWCTMLKMSGKRSRGRMRKQTLGQQAHTNTTK